ncbi:MAG: dTMP kinase [Microthrixaceae bacterium]
MTGRFIVLEGGEGCGKSTQVGLLADELGALATRQPGGTELGSRLRALLLAAADDPVPLDERAEALLMAADRAQHVAEVIEPTLATGRHVVCDRYTPSTIAYQGHGRGLDVDWLRRLAAWAARDLQPDLVVLLDVPADVAAERRGAVSDRIEAAGGAFHRRVTESYLQQAASDPGTWVVLDGSGTADEVAAAVRAAVADRLGI